MNLEVGLPIAFYFNEFRYPIQIRNSVPLFLSYYYNFDCSIIIELLCPLGEVTKISAISFFIFIQKIKARNKKRIIKLIFRNFLYFLHLFAKRYICVIGVYKLISSNKPLINFDFMASFCLWQLFRVLVSWPIGQFRIK